jgi:hypothetical protein
MHLTINAMEKEINRTRRKTRKIDDGSSGCPSK